VLGEAPSHPELLDYLAADFVESGWDVKRLIRRIVLSSVYGEASVALSDASVGDPANRLLHRARVRRIPAESIRDALLAISGTLDRTPFGPSVPIFLNDFMRHNRSPATSGPLDGARRRSIYLEVRRNALSHFLAAFDKPAPFTCVGRRTKSNNPAQPLTLLNDPLVHQLVSTWAEQLTSEFAEDQLALVHAYRAALGRAPTQTELDASQQWLIARVSNATDDALGARRQAWRDLCLALVNSKEFVYLP
ncbi:MAG: DUF1553 domain-containing protein, partial [Planctomycetales bacterium]|nr:DUF1553 domain-containing protein [Planctomycetales bacterium]